MKLDEGHHLDGAAEMRAAVLADVTEVNVTAVDIGGGDELPADAALRFVGLIPSEAILGRWRWRELRHRFPKICVNRSAALEVGIDRAVLYPAFHALS